MEQGQEKDNRDIEFIYLCESDDDKQVRQKLMHILAEITYFDASEEIDYEERDLFWKIINQIRTSRIVTVVVEAKHIDASYTDTYYNHFAGLHLYPSKYCKRLSFFKGEISLLHFLEQDRHETLYDNLMGTMVLRPLRHGFIGKTLLDPGRINICSGNKLYIRRAKFIQHILGVEFEIYAFPFCSQDSCFMTCAEVTIMNMMEYYAVRYHAYKTVLPSDIKRVSQKYQYERVTPSAGLTYLVVSKILSEFGFTPRLYNIESIKIHPLVGDERENEIKRIMHYYVESGIPVAVNVEPRQGELREGHSLLCVGHSDYRDEHRAQKYSLSGRHCKHAVINSADFYTQYCVVDDHLEPYAVRSYQEMSIFDNMWISNLAVPLYKKMYLEATYAYDICYKIFKDSKFGLECWCIPEEYLKNDEAVVMRIYQASSRSYKSFKVDSYGGSDKYAQLDRKALLAELQLPQFIWCCEFFSYVSYMEAEPLAFAEIILDATALLRENNYADAVVAIETVDRFLVRENNRPYKKIKENILEQATGITIYTKNLDEQDKL